MSSFSNSVITSVVSPEVEAKFVEGRQLRWEDFTPERVSFLNKAINEFYTTGVGIQASDLCRILYGYYPARKTYEGICFHIFNLVATKDGTGHVYFIRKSEIGSSAYPVIASIWHNLDSVVEEETISSSVRDSLESSFGVSDSIDTSRSSLLSSVLSEMLGVCSKLSNLLSKMV